MSFPEAHSIFIWVSNIGTILELACFLFFKKSSNEHTIFVNEIKSSLRERFTYNNGILTSAEESVLIDNYKEVIEIFCTPNLYESKSVAEFIQPKEITSFVSSYFNPEKQGGEFYNPFFGLGSYSLCLPNYNFKGEEINTSVWALAMIRLHANGIIGSFVLNSDSRNSDPDATYDGIIATPPFIMHGELATENLIEKYYERLNDKGILVMVVPASFLFSCSKSVQYTRLKLIENRAVANVTLFPDGIFWRTSLATAMIVITKTPNQTATFTDASKAFENKQGAVKQRIFSQVLLEEQIANQTEEDRVSITVYYDKVLNKMSIYPPKFLEPVQFYISRALEDICEVSVPAQFPNGAKNLPYFSPANLTPEFARTSIKVENLVKRDIKPGRYYYVDFPAVLFDYNPKTDVTRVAYVDSIPNDGFIVSQGVCVLATRNNQISEKYLMLMLSDKRVKRQLKERTLGGYIQKIKPSDLATVQIPILTNEEEEKLFIEAMDASMSETEREAKDAFSKYKKEVRIRKHALSQTISSLSALWNSLERFRESNGIISGTDIIGRANPTSVNDICHKISGLMNTIISQTESIADVEFDWGKPEWLDFFSTIPRIARKYENPSYTIAFGGSYDSQMIERIKNFQKENGELDVNEWLKSEEQFDKHLKECVEFPAKALERIILNIVSNATSYGFTDSTRKDYRIFYDWFEEDGNIVLAISNNGTPLKNDASADMVLSYGYSTNLNESGHSGIGGHEISSIMEQFGGKAEFISTPDEEYTVTYKLTFTKCSEFMPEDEED